MLQYGKSYTALAISHVLAYLQAYVIATSINANYIVLLDSLLMDIELATVYRVKIPTSFTNKWWSSQAALKSVHIEFEADEYICSRCVDWTC